MKGYARIWILALAALVSAGPAAVFARDLAPLLFAASDGQDADSAEEAPNLDVAEEPGEEIDEIDEEPPEARVIDAISVVVQNADEKAVEEAAIELSAENRGGTFKKKKITDDEGVARFKNLPAERLHVKVTAGGYRSYSDDFIPENGDDPFVMKLQKRD
jgi:hypothetical protein